MRAERALSSFPRISRLPGGTVALVTAFGAKGDGVTDDTAAFEAAEAALPASGGTVLVPSGTYITAYRMRKAYVTLEGASWNAILKTPPHASVVEPIDMQTATSKESPVRMMAPYCRVTGLQIDGNRSGNVGNDIVTDAYNGNWDGVGIYADYCTVDNCYVHSVIGHKIIVWNRPLADAVAPAVNAARTGCVIKDNLIVGRGQRASLDIASDQGQGASFDQNINFNHQIIGNFVYNGWITSHTSWDILIADNHLVDSNISVHTGSRRIQVHRNFLYGGEGIQLNGTTYLVRECSATNNTIRGTTAGNDGVRMTSVQECSVEGNRIFAPAQYGIIATSTVRCRIANNFIKDAVSRGITTTGTSTFTDFLNNTIIGLAGVPAFSFGNLQDSVIDGNSIYGGTNNLQSSTTTATRLRISNNRGYTATANGFDLACINSDIFGNYVRTAASNALQINQSGNRIRRNHIDDPGTRGIALASATATKCWIEENDINDAASVALSIDVGAAAPVIRNNRIVFGGVTYHSSNSGTATIASGATSIAVTHGLQKTPTVKDIIVTPTNSLGNAAKFWVSAVAATTFTISVNADPGATTATFAWQAVLL